MNGYIDPLNLKERLAHVAAAKKSLKTEFIWICDNMDNELKHALGNAPNSEFVIDPQGKVVIKRVWSNPRQLRTDLAKLVGESERVTTVGDLGYRIDARAKQAPKGIVERISLPGRMAALKTQLESNSEGEKYFVKLRAEADRGLLQEGRGKLYLAFHLDPIYQVHWNNQGPPISYELKLPSQVTAKQPSGAGPKVEAAADSDPREFLIDLQADQRNQPIELTVKFMVCDDAETFCVPVTQTYSVLLEQDPELGWRFTGRRGNRGNQRANMVQRMLRRDKNGDGKISKDELPQQAQQLFERLDKNNDGFIDKDELNTLRGGGR